MEPYTGFEPQVGEIRAVRTFRVGPDGMLYPLFSDAAWSSQVNTARCNLPTQASNDAAASPHETPEPDCACGYYAYASEMAAAEYPNARHVLAVVACWGRIIAGTRGVRSQHCRIEAVWMSSTVPEGLAATVAERYSDAVIYADKQLMFAEHPLTVLDCYDTDSPEHAARRIVVRIAVVGAVILGLLPSAWLESNSNLHLIWLVELGLVVVAAVIAYRRSGVAAKRRLVHCCALALWLLSPVGGVAGTFLLRLPLIQLAALVHAQRRVLAREANRFPARIGTLER